MKVLVCGGRYYNDRHRGYKMLSDYHNKHDITEIIQGGALGADNIASDWADRHGIKNTEFRPDWNDLTAPGAVIRINKYGRRYNAKAGFDRNQRMLKIGKPDLVIAFPGGNGTADMVARARAADIDVIEIKREQKR